MTVTTDDGSGEGLQPERDKSTETDRLSALIVNIETDVQAE